MGNKPLKYEVDIFDVKSLEKLENLFSNVLDTLQSEEFMNDFALKCMKELNEIIDEKLNTENYTTDYRDNNNYETKKDQIRIYNDSMVDLSELSKATRGYYENGLSLAKLVEFGTGVPRNK